jgi:glycine dehydrogenase subunit 2
LGQRKLRRAGPRFGLHLGEVTETALLNANYIKAALKGAYNLPFLQPSLHECVFNDASQCKSGVATLDIAKRLIDFGFPPTIYFPLVVESALMIEPTESESKADLDGFVEAIKTIAEESSANPQAVKDTPKNTSVSKPDEVRAARYLILRGETTKRR